MKEKLQEINDKERAWIKAQIESADEFVRAFSPRDASQPLTLAALDRAFAAWIASASTNDAKLINAVVNYVGVAFGHLLVEGIGMRWVIATDERGSDWLFMGYQKKGTSLFIPRTLWQSDGNVGKQIFLTIRIGRLRSKCAHFDPRRSERGQDAELYL